MAPPVRHPPSETPNSCKIQLNTKKIKQLTRGYFISIVSANIFKENKGNTWQRFTTRRFRVSAITEPYWKQRKSGFTVRETVAFSRRMQKKLSSCPRTVGGSRKQNSELSSISVRTTISRQRLLRGLPANFLILNRPWIPINSTRLSRSLNSCRNLIKLHLLFRNRIYRL